VNVKKIDNNKVEKKSHLMASNIILFDIGNIKFLHLLSPQCHGQVSMVTIIGTILLPLQGDFM